MGKLKNRVGEKHTTNEGYEVEVVEYFKWNDCTIKFLDGLVLKNIQYTNLKVGNVRNPYHKSLLETGYMGEGEYKTKIDGKTTKVYSAWNGMIVRGYCSKYKEKNTTYKDVTVCKEWHNFQEFSKWFYNNWKPYMDESWNLDKDILVKGNKIYSPETCCFVPQEINKSLILNNNNRNLPTGIRYKKEFNKYQPRITIGKKEKYLGFYDTLTEACKVYATAKELHIKELADKWKDQITEKVYQAMYNYQVEIITHLKTLT